MESTVYRRANYDLSCSVAVVTVGLKGIGKSIVEALERRARARSSDYGGLARCRFRLLANTGVLVNAIAPAAVRTDLLDQMSPQHVATMLSKSPMGRLGEPAEVAELTLWLCSGSCTFSTGAVFDLSGGRATY
jgi:hypothetical protein